MRPAFFVMALGLSLLLSGTATAQQDANGNGRFEVCVLTSGEHEGQLNFEFAEVSAEEVAASNITHVAYYQPNADGSCPATPEEGVRIPREAFPAAAAAPPDAQTPAEEDEAPSEPTAAVDQSGSELTTEESFEPRYMCGLMAGEAAPYTLLYIETAAENLTVSDQWDYLTTSDGTCPAGHYRLAETSSGGVGPGPGWEPEPVAGDPAPTVTPTLDSTTVRLCVFHVIEDSTGQQIGAFETIQTTEDAVEGVLADFPYGFVLGAGDTDCQTEGLFVLDGGTYFPYEPDMDDDLVTICRWVATATTPHWAENRVPEQAVGTLLEDETLYAELDEGGECPSASPTQASSPGGASRPTTSVRALPSTGVGAAGSVAVPLAIAALAVAFAVGAVSNRR